MAVPVARVTPPAVVRRLGEASEVLGAASGFLEAIANLLRQLVHIAGWAVLLYSSIHLLLDPHLTPEHFVVPGAGALAVLQSLIRPRRRNEGMVMSDETPLAQAEPSSEMEAVSMEDMEGIAAQSEHRVEA